MVSVNLSLTAHQLELRRLKLKDIDDIMAIESVSFGRFHWSAHSFEQEMNNRLARYWVVLHHEPDNRTIVVGYVGYWLVFDEIHITTLAVSPDYRQNALGELLVAKVIEQAQSHSARTVTLEVRKGNTPAQRLYTKYAFEVMGIRPQYYQDNNEDALIMTNPDVLAAPFREQFKGLKSQLFARLDGQPTGFLNP